MQPQLVIMAAGIGSRYGGLKQIDPVGPCDEIIIDYSIYDALRAGFCKIIFVIRRDMESLFRDKIGRHIEAHADVAYVFQSSENLPKGFHVPADRTKPWGTAHAVLCAQEQVSAPFAVINADDFYGAGAFQILADFLKNIGKDPHPDTFCMVGYELANTLTEHGHVSRGICTADDDGFLLDIVERTKIQKFGDKVKYAENEKDWHLISSTRLVSMNMWGFTANYFLEVKNRFPKFLEQNIDDPKAEFFVPTIVNELILEKKAVVKVLPTDEKWFGVTYPDDKPMVKVAIRGLIANNVYPENLWKAAHERPA